MPFIIKTNESYLELEWSDDQSLQQLNIQNLSENYSYIDVVGPQIDFYYYELLKKTQSLHISGLKIDLSQIKWRIEYVTLVNCICVNNFTTECIISQLYLDDAQIQVEQLKNLRINLLNVNVTKNNRFDYFNCHLLHCKQFNQLTLTEQKVDLDKIQCCWTSIQYDDCVFNGQVNKQAFNHKNISVKITEITQNNNFDQLDNIICDQFNLQVNGSIENGFLNLQLKNLNKQKRIMSVQIHNSICDLEKIYISCQNIQFYNCLLKGDATTYQSRFSESSIEVKMDQLCKNVDFQALIGINTTLNIILTHVKANFNHVLMCKPRLLQIFDCEINLNELVGNWDILQINNCQLTDFVCPQNYCVVSKKLIILDFDYKFCKCFNTKWFILTNTCVDGSFPNVNQLEIRQSTVNITHTNNTISHLTLSNVYLKRFSLLNLQKLETIDLNSIQKTKHLLKLRKWQ
ncbi:Hypothetical_protein [Hexamita inflata]|uniref:Hypothetical_protein n=1 Tax=Hexamita inflata TaxID=28002 RepID=A0AA86NAF1_9EUKA|nr:Hypothetical protein HINF_LOCUS3430 [Hexamita inflata]